MTNAQPAENNPKNNPVLTAKFWALIPCGGSGSRAQSGAAHVPKQYRVIAGKPMVMHTLAAFAQLKTSESGLAGGLVVVAKDDDYWEELLKTHEFTALNAMFSIAAQAGNTRAATVFNGLKALKDAGASDTDWVLVHDAARCLIMTEQILHLMASCNNDDVGGLLALPLPDTLKSEKDGKVAATLGRSDKWLAQTPQMFRIGALLQALQAAGDLSDPANALITDESSAMERMGHAPKLVMGSAQNFKVTYPEDFAFAELVLRARANQIS